jgi:lipoprotein NlpI
LAHPSIETAPWRSAAAVAFALLLSSCAGGSGGDAAKTPLPYDATLAIAAMQEHDYREAALHWTSVLDVTTLTPEQRADAYAGRASSYVRFGEVDLAVADTEAAIALKADKPQLHVLRGGLYLEKHKPDKAREEFDLALHIKPGFPEALASRGAADLQQGQIDQAITDLDAAIAAKSYVAGFFIGRGDAYQLAGKNDLAMADFNEAVRRDPRDADVYKARWLAFYHAGNIPAAISDLKQSLTLNPDQPYLAIWLHLLRQRAKEADAAEFSQNLANLHVTKWPLPIVDFYRGTLNAGQMTAAATDNDPDIAKIKQCEAAFYAAHPPSGNRKTDDTRRQLTLAEQTCPIDFIEHQLAQIELRGM